MRLPSRSPSSSAELVYLSAIAINQLIQGLPSGTNYFIGIVLIVMMSGRLAQSKGSLARAAWPLVTHIKWGWHRAERAMERGQLCLDNLIEQAYDWSLTHLDVQPMQLGPLQRAILAADTTTVARLRSQDRNTNVWGKGYSHHAGHAVRANVVAALVSVVRVRSTTVGLLRSLRFGPSSEATISTLFNELPPRLGCCLIIVDAGIAIKERFAAATKERALAGRLRKNSCLRCSPPPPTGKRGRPRLHGERLHPGRACPEVDADEEMWIGSVQLRRWRDLHYQGYHQTRLDVLRVDDPAYGAPLLVATTAWELSTLELFQVYPHRWPVEVLFYVGQDSCATEMPRAWADSSVARRIGLGLLVASLLKAISAMGEGLALGPWDRKPKPTAGRLAYHLNSHIVNFMEVALRGVKPRTYRKNLGAPQARDWRWDEAA